MLRQMGLSHTFYISLQAVSRIGIISYLIRVIMFGKLMLRQMGLSHTFYISLQAVSRIGINQLSNQSNHVWKANVKTDGSITYFLHLTAGS